MRSLARGLHFEPERIKSYESSKQRLEAIVEDLWKGQLPEAEDCFKAADTRGDTEEPMIS